VARRLNVDGIYGQCNKGPTYWQESIQPNPAQVYLQSIFEAYTTLSRKGVLTERRLSKSEDFELWAGRYYSWTNFVGPRSRICVAGLKASRTRSFIVSWSERRLGSPVDRGASVVQTVAITRWVVAPPGGPESCDGRLFGGSFGEKGD
jgi:hypothetical protein